MFTGRRISITRLAAALVASALAAGATRAGWGFNTGLGPEKTRDVLCAPECPAPSPGAWLRLLGMPRSLVYGSAGSEIPAWREAKPGASIEERRGALMALRGRGYRLVAVLEWPTTSWQNGQRSGLPYRRLPLDLREAYERCRQLAVTYGDLVDYWEIENEPDVSFVEENPETYAAFQKACYLGFKAGAVSGKRKVVSTADAAAEDGGRRTDVGSNQPSAVGRQSSGSVLAAAFALPPGPYFDAWVANDGLRYTDGFNYHYYGYAEDFTGVYHQFHAAVASAQPTDPAGAAVLQTRFFPTDSALMQRTLFRFDFSADAAQANREALLHRPRAVAEPEFKASGRWLVTPGVSVREVGEEWEFTVTAPPEGQIRPPMAELPLPSGFTWDEATHLRFEVRAESLAKADDSAREAVSGKGEVLAEDGPRMTDDGPATTQVGQLAQGGQKPTSGRRTEQKGERMNSKIRYAPPVIERPLPLTSSRLPATRPRELPVFLTEYGYGIWLKDGALQAGGREAQLAWFEDVRPQIHKLGIEGAMAFVLMPSLQQGDQEFGLLIDPRVKREALVATATAVDQAAAVRPPASGVRPLWSPYTASPALVSLTSAKEKPAKKRTWGVTTMPPSSVVIDFVAGPELVLAKTYRSYVLRGEKAEGRLVMYNFGTTSVVGALSLEGSAWALAADAREESIELSPGERREVAVTIQLAPTERFVAQEARARFVVASPGIVAPKTIEEVSPSQVSGLRSPPSKAVASTPPPWAASYEVYLRTIDGNLYYTWPPPEARMNWQMYSQSLDNFTPAIFGRTHLPAPLARGKTASLMICFRPQTYPVTFRLRGAQLAEYFTPRH